MNMPDTDSIGIETLAYAEPPEVISSAAIEERLGPVYERLRLPAGRLELMTGIKERRFWESSFLPSSASALAGERALKASTIGKEKIDLLIHCGVCRDRLEPATASYVHRLLDLPEACLSFDVSNACLGFLNGLMLCAKLMEAGAVRYALIVSGENGRSLLENTISTLLNKKLSRKEIKPYFANLTIGAGAVAAVVCAKKDVSRKDGFLEFGLGATRTDSSANHLCKGDATQGGQLEMLTDSEGLLEAGVDVAARTWSDFKKKTGWDETTPDRIICHQVGRQHQRAMFSRLGLPLERDYSTFENWGNVGSVSLPLTLAKALEAGAIARGDNLALMGIGSGLVCAIFQMRYV